SRRRHTRSKRDWSSDVCSSDLARSLQKLGVEVHIKSQARGWREDKGQTVVDIVTPEGLIARRADIILVTVGRRPNTDDLHAEVRSEERRVGKGGGSVRGTRGLE